ncbi:C-type mannose receptor 2-like protein [Leptotrombidium deliense]|uniref:C-type mannose receptor 2-like protein n=1 Tax=Leptotrombidium deliense TaxID=299467 RepID=A0A443S4V1_9ACAR|nr:C-type mannose receptor 2-like protein [Leptotrombidium deliense]
MVTIHSWYENEYLPTLFKDGYWYWLGGRRAESGKEYVKWDDGSEFDFSSTFRNQWSNNETGYDYLKVYVDGFWMFTRAEENANQMCEKILFSYPPMIFNLTEITNVTNAPKVNKSASHEDDVSSTNFVTGICEAGWFQFSNKCYFVNHTKATRVENINNCANLNASLVSIHSDEENDFISLIVPTFTWFWLGGRKVEGTHDYFWSDETEFDYYREFYEFENHLKVKKESYNFLQIHKDGDWRWYIEDDKIQQLCQKESVGTDAKTVLISEMSTSFKTSLTRCEPYWYRFENKCFWKNNDYVDRETNEINCRRMGATMISIHSKEENEFISQMTAKNIIYWLGGQRHYLDADNPQWDDESRFDFENWMIDIDWKHNHQQYMQFNDGKWIFAPNYEGAQLCQKFLKKSRWRRLKVKINNRKAPSIFEVVDEMFERLNDSMSSLVADMKHEIFDSFGSRSEKLSFSKQPTITPSNVHIYVFAVLFAFLFAAIICFASMIVYRRNKSLLHNSLLNRVDDENL